MREGVSEEVTFEQRLELEEGHNRREFHAIDLPLKTVLEVGKGLARPTHRNEACVAVARGCLVGRALRELSMGQIHKRGLTLSQENWRANNSS